MGLKSEKGGASGPLLDIEESNKIVLLLCAALILLVFMDFQARRRYQNFQSETLSSRIEKVEKLIPQATATLSQDDYSLSEVDGEEGVEPLRKSAAEIFGFNGVDELPNLKPSPVTEMALKELEVKQAAQMEKPPAATSRVVPIEKFEKFNFYFIRFNRSRSELVRVTRSYNSTELTPLRLLETLQSGPLPGERGLLSAFDSNSHILNLEIEQGIATVDLDDGVTRNGKRLVRDRIDQVVLTLKSYPGVKDVRFKLNGKAVSEIAGVKVSSSKKRKVVDFKP